MMLPLLAGCGQARYDTTESTKILLPKIVQYDAEIQSMAADEVRSGSCPALTEFTKDYVQLRDRLRLVRDELK